MTNDSEPIENLGLSAKLCEIFKRAGIATVGQLLSLNYAAFI
jgi:hypothetical protein